MTLLSDVISGVTESQYWARLTGAYDSAKPPVPWRAWDILNPFLALSRFTTQALSELRDIVAYLASGMYLETGEGAALELFVKSQYQLVPTGAVFAHGRMLLQSVVGASAQTFAAGQIIVGTPGPFSSVSRLYTNLEGGTLDPGGLLLLEFGAQVAGDAYNLPVLSLLDLKTSYAGISVSNPPSGAATAVGSGNAGLLFYANAPGVTVTTIVAGANMPLVVIPVAPGVIVSLATNGASAPISTADEVRKSVKNAVAGGMPYVWDCRNAGDGTGIVAVTASPVPLQYAGTWLSQAGAPRQTSDTLKTLAGARWDTLGGGAGDGAPASDAGTSDALIFWGLQVPVGYAATPVKRIRAYSNLDPDTGLASGGVITVMIAGPAGALTADDVAAVEALYYKPRKFSWGSRLAVRSASNLVVSLAGTVNVKISSGRTLVGVQASVEAALTDYAEGTQYTDGRQNEPGFDIGQMLYPQTLGSRISDADKAGIRDVVLTSPSVPAVATYAQIPVLDLSGLVYVLV